MTEFLGELSIWGFFSGQCKLDVANAKHVLSDCGQSSIKQCMQRLYVDTLFTSDQSVNNVSAYGAADTEQLFTYVILSEMAL